MLDLGVDGIMTDRPGDAARPARAARAVDDAVSRTAGLAADRAPLAAAAARRPGAAGQAGRPGVVRPRAGHRRRAAVVVLAVHAAPVLLAGQHLRSGRGDRRRPRGAPRAARCCWRPTTSATSTRSSSPSPCTGPGVAPRHHGHRRHHRGAGRGAAAGTHRGHPGRARHRAGRGTPSGSPRWRWPHGGHVVAYPEGRVGLTADGWPERGRTGLARMALGVGVPVHPGQPVGGPRGAAVRQRLGQAAHGCCARSSAGRPAGARRSAGVRSTTCGRAGSATPTGPAYGSPPRSPAAWCRCGAGETGGRDFLDPTRPDHGGGGLPRRRRAGRRPVSRMPRCWTRRPRAWHPAAVTDRAAPATPTPAPGCRPRPGAAPRAVRLVLLRLGQLGLHHDGRHRLPRPVPDLDRRGAPPTPTAGSTRWASAMPPGSLLRLRRLAVGAAAGVRAAGDRRRRRPHRPQAAAAGGARLPRRAACTMALFFVAGERYLLGAGAVRRSPTSLRRLHRRLLLVAARPGRARRARHGLQPRLGATATSAARLLLAAQPRRCSPRYDELRPDRGRGGADLPGVGGRLVGGVHRRHRHAAARPRPAARRRSRTRRRRHRAAGSFRQLGATLRDLRRYPLTLWFLGAYLLFNDGVQTVITVSAQYGNEELRLSQTTLVSTILLVQFVAFGGALALGRIAQAVGAEAHRARRAWSSGPACWSPPTSCRPVRPLQFYAARPGDRHRPRRHARR